MVKVVFSVGITALLDVPTNTKRLAHRFGVVSIRQDGSIASSCLVEICTCNTALYQRRGLIALLPFLIFHIPVLSRPKCRTSIPVPCPEVCLFSESLNHWSRCSFGRIWWKDMQTFQCLVAPITPPRIKSIAEIVEVLGHPGSFPRCIAPITGYR